MGQDSFTDITGAAEVTKLSKSLLYKLTAQFKIPHYKVRSRLFFKIAELQSWMEAGKQPVISETTNYFFNPKTN
ncbi:MAG: hypothetical protein NVSMB45_01100 [Ginsengibacter sp.]